MTGYILMRHTSQESIRKFENSSQQLLLRTGVIKSTQNVHVYLMGALNISNRIFLENNSKENL
jgi:hypothetical protein